MELFRKREESDVLNPDPLVNLIMEWANKMVNENSPYDKRVVDMTLELMEMDSKMCMTKAEFVLNFFKTNEIQGVNGEVLVKKLEEGLGLMKEKHEKIVEMKGN